MTPMERAAKLIAEADGLLITAGAGMGVDSGLPDFRGSAGFWKAYPALGKAGIDFSSIASPYAFVESPRRAWGFYGHRLALYRRTVPHDGFHILKEIAARLPNGSFVVTSNVDGQFQKAGFADNQVLEVHGSIHRLQCMQPCHAHVWSADAVEPRTDDAACEWIGPRLPTCPRCRGLARPNILMFNDGGWVDTYATIGRAWLERWLERARTFVVLEIGAGTGLPTIRRMGRSLGVPLIRINPLISGNEDAEVVLAHGALAGLQGLRQELETIGWMGRVQSS